MYGNDRDVKWLTGFATHMIELSAVLSSLRLQRRNRTCYESSSRTGHAKVRQPPFSTVLLSTVFNFWLDSRRSHKNSAGRRHLDVCKQVKKRNCTIAYPGKIKGKASFFFVLAAKTTKSWWGKKWRAVSWTCVRRETRFFLFFPSWTSIIFCQRKTFAWCISNFEQREFFLAFF